MQVKKTCNVIILPPVIKMLLLSLMKQTIEKIREAMYIII